MHCLIAGATGYVGRRLVPGLLADGHTVRCLVRNPAKLAAEPWSDQVEPSQGDVLDEASLNQATQNVDILYYLVHSLHDNTFEDLDRRAAELTAHAAANAGVSRIVYLGGLGEPNTDLSPHLNSRTEVAEIFLNAPTPAIVLRAGLIVGAGSTSFEMLRHLMHCAPVLANAPWLDVRTQPIAIRDVLHYLTSAATIPGEHNRTFDLGGPDALSYRELIRGFAEAAGLPAPVVLPTPSPPRALSARLASLLAPVNTQLAGQLIESLEHEMVRTESDIDELVPEHQLLSFADSVRAASANVPPPQTQQSQQAPVDAAWPSKTDPPGSGGPMFSIETRLRSTASQETLWSVVKTIGGEQGWYTLPLVWEIRATTQRLLGNEAATRGRTNPEQLRQGQSIDWWRVHAVTPGRSVLLQSELNAPGTLWLELSVLPDERSDERPAAEETEFRQRLFFAPKGPAGYAYWYAARPMHEVTFEVMARNIVRAAERRGTFATPAIAAASIAANAAQRTLSGTLRLLNRRLGG